MITLYTILVILALVMQAVFALSEIVFTTANRAAVRERSETGEERARLTHELLQKDDKYLGTTLVGTNLAVVVYSILVTRIFMEYFDWELIPLLTTLCLLPVTLLFAEIIPKMIGRHFATPLSYWLVRSMMRFFGLFQPLIVAVNFIARGLLFPFRKFKSGGWSRSFTKSDLKRILLLGHETGQVEADEVELIHKVLDFGSKKVRSIMVPLFRVSSISEEETVENLKRLVCLTNFSRIPVYRDKKDNITGIVNIYDILFSENVANGSEKVGDFSREAVYVTEEDGLDIALTRLRYRKRPMGIVTGGEQNAVVGIVTIEDMLEEIVGDI